MNFKNKILTRSNKYFSFKASSDKDRRLNQFFKLPKTKMGFEDKVFDRPDEEYSVMNTYNDQDLDRMDIMDKIIKKKKLESQSSINKFFANSSSTEKVKITENLIEKLRMNKEFKFTEEYKQKEILNEYGNYDKYFSNYKTTKEKKYNSDDDGESVWESKYSELQQKFKNPGTRESWEKDKKTLEDKVKQDIATYGSDYSFIDYLSAKKNDGMQYNSTTTNPRTAPLTREEVIERNEDELASFPPDEEKYDHRTKKEKNAENAAKLFDEVDDEIDKAGFTHEKDEDDFEQDKLADENQIHGRVSPWCKEEIYRSYLEGWTVKDLSYKYGLLPERVKVIVWTRDIFWKEVYPKIGESGLRRRLEKGIEYAKRFAYIDYGKDLRAMAEREQGVFLRKVARSEIDCKPTKEVEEKVSAVLKNIRPKTVDYIPIKFHGKGASGYLIKDMVCKRKKGSKRVSHMFQKFCFYKDLHPNLLPEKVLARKELGPRLATLGYKF